MKRQYLNSKVKWKSSKKLNKNNKGVMKRNRY